MVGSPVVSTKVDLDSYRRHYSRPYVHDERCSQDVLNLCDKIDALRAEIDGLRRLLKGANIESQAEIERLQADQRLLDESVRNQAIRESIHKEELNRLRAALEKIASAVFYTKRVPLEAKNLQYMAREALGRCEF